jgi:glycosyltransferase involved in cell wall biosynthesis
MRLLVIAYEYPPVAAAQSLRWFYLANELAALGVDVEVLTTRIRDVWGFRGRIHPEITVHRCFPGPFIGAAGWLSARLGHNPGPADRAAGAAPGLAERGYRRLRRLLDNLLFPDLRSEWLPFARRALADLLGQRQYDVLISAHEPGVDLLLGRWARRRWRLPWIVDLADPVLTPYTPVWRRRLDARFEAAICRQADHVVVTTNSALDCLCARHGLKRERFSVITQGFDAAPDGQTSPVAPSAGEFVLVYTGSLYADFRNPAELIEALAAVPRCRLMVAGHVGACRPLFQSLGEQVSLLGQRDHRDCLSLQRRASLLISLGNRQSYQIPGKLFEYFGAARPILHIASSADDPAAEVLAATRRGMVVVNRRERIAAALRELYQDWEAGALDRRFDLTPGAVRAYAWSAGAARLRDLCEQIRVAA